MLCSSLLEMIENNKDSPEVIAHWTIYYLKGTLITQLRINAEDKLCVPIINALFHFYYFCRLYESAFAEKYFTF